jgi:hypothetical protein
MAGAKSLAMTSSCSGPIGTHFGYCPISRLDV